MSEVLPQPRAVQARAPLAEHSKLPLLVVGGFQANSLKSCVQDSPLAQEHGSGFSEHSFVGDLEKGLLAVANG